MRQNKVSYPNVSELAKKNSYHLVRGKWNCLGYAAVAIQPSTSFSLACLRVELPHESRR